MDSRGLCARARICQQLDSQRPRRLAASSPQSVPAIHSLWTKRRPLWTALWMNRERIPRIRRAWPLPGVALAPVPMLSTDFGARCMRLHLHLLSDSTGETLENIAKAALAQFDDVETIRHFWPMVRTEGASRPDPGRDRRSNPGLVLFTLVNAGYARAAGRALPRARPARGRTARSGDRCAVAACSARQAKARPGRQHVLDAAYFARVDAIQFTIAHDDGIGSEDWEEADIVLAGVSRSSKTPTSHLSRQSRLQDRQHPDRGRKPAAAGAVRAASIRWSSG